MKVAIVNMKVELDKKANLEKHIAFITQAAQEKADLVVFPELSLTGYLWDIQRNPPAEEVRYFLQEAEKVPGPSSLLLMEEAKRRSLMLVFGMAETVSEGVVCDSSILIGTEGTIGVHRKVHLIGDESHIFKAGRHWKVWETPLGRLGMMVCYDKTFPESARELVLAGAEILIVISAWAAAGNEPKGDFLGGLYDLYDRARASENQCWLLSANQVGMGAKTTKIFYGNGKVVDPSGRVIAEAGFEEGMITAQIDVQAGIMKARTRGVYVGTNLLKDRRPETYQRIGADTGIEKGKTD